MNILIVIYKDFNITIWPMLWYIWPVFKKDYTDNRKCFCVRAPHKVHDFWTQNIVFQYQVLFKVTFLCFTVCVPWWQKNEDVATIYPKDYDYKTDPEWKEKYDQLVNTGYFN